MAVVPAICESCGTVCSSGIDIGERARNIRLTGNTVTCPACGSRARVPDGYYEAIAATELVRAASPADIDALRAILERLRSGEVDLDGTAEQLQKSGPAGRAIASRLISSRDNRIELWTFVTMLAAILALWVALHGDAAKPPPAQATRGPGQTVTVDINVDIDKVIQDAVQGCFGHTVLPPPRTQDHPHDSQPDPGH